MNITNKSMPLLQINDLTVIAKTNKSHNINNCVEYHKQQSNQSQTLTPTKTILENLNLNIYPGEIHVIMGPNGAGKSTLAQILVNHPDYLVAQGSINYLGEDLANLTPSDCASKGIFLSFQHPIAIPGVSNLQFLKTSLNAINKTKNLPLVDAIDFLNLVKQKMQELQIPEEFLYRSINEDFSGGEKKRNEILQMLLLSPTLIILDEIDSGLDMDALKLIANSIKNQLNSNNAVLIITHYQRILDYLKPDLVHILLNKKIVASGDYTLVAKLEQQGYSYFSQNN